MRQTTTYPTYPLEHKGFVEQLSSPDDRRKYKLFPMETAKQTYPKIVDVLDAQEHVFVDDMSEAEQYLLRTLLEKERENLN